LALARIDPIDAAMLDKGTTWQPRVPTRTRVLSGSQTSTIGERVDRAGSPAESPAAAQGESRPAESHWESVIDRATD
jgi:hypothetical protein